MVAVSATTLGTGLLVRLVGSGMQRLGSLTFQKIIRLMKVDGALKGVISKNPVVQTAINDFETVLGNRYGQFTVQISNFLRELERSGLINSMVESAIIGSDTAELRRVFADMHLRILESENGDAGELFDRMMASFAVTVSELVKDKSMLDAIRIFRSEVTNRLEKIDFSIIDVSNKSLLQQPSFNVVRETLARIAKSLQSSYRSIRIETNKGARAVEITKIYIPPKLRYRDTRKNSERLNVAGRVLKSALQKQGGNDFEIDAEVGKDVLSGVTYQDVKMSFNRVVILGDPGGGKSTLCQHLCYDLAKQAVASFQTSATNLTAQLQKFPLRVILRSYEKARTIEPQLSIYDFIFRDLRNNVNAEDRDLDAALKYLLSSGCAVIAFDGLDEILATAQRREFVDLVTSFSRQFPFCPVLVTSRLVGYDDAPLSDAFDELILERFDDQEVLDYAKKFMKVVGGHDDKLASKNAALFYSQTTSNAADLRRNPLMLGLMAWLFNMRGDVPSNRPEIYRECAILMFEKWDPDRDIKADIPSNFDRLQLFSNIASKVFGNPELSAGVKEEWLEREIRVFFQEIYENRGQAHSAAKALVAFITGRAWVMSDVGDKVFAFTHQTFLEYFFARHIDEMYDTVVEVMDAIIPRVLRREWDMVSHLSLQIKTHRNLRRQNEALDGLLAELRTKRDPKQLEAMTSFAARALEYLAGAEAHVKPLITHIVLSGFARAEKGEIDAWGDVSQCAQSCIERRDFVRGIIVQLLVEEYRSGNPGHLEILTHALNAPSENIFVGEAARGLPSDLANLVKRHLRQYVMERVEQDGFHAVRAWEWYGTISKKLITKHGILPYYKGSRPDFYGLDGLTAMVLAASGRYASHFPSTLSHKKASEALALFGAAGFSGTLRKDRFEQRNDGNPPLYIWETILDQFQKNPNVLAGCLFVMMLVTDVHNQTEDRFHGRRGKTRLIKRDDLINKVMENSALSGLKIYPSIVAATQRGSVFK